MIYEPIPYNRCKHCKIFYPWNRANFTYQKGYGLTRCCLPCKRLRENSKLSKYVARKYDYNKRYKQQHAAEIKARYSTPEYKEKMRLRGRWERQSNPEKSREACRKWRNNHPEQQAEATRKWMKAHPEEIKRHSHKRRSIEKNLTVDFTVDDWQRCLDYFDHRCAVCDRPPGLWHILAQDHWIPVTKGGQYTPDNIVPLCHNDSGCNNHKSNRDPMGWLISTYGPRKAKQINRRIQKYFDKVRR